MSTTPDTPTDAIDRARGTANLIANRDFDTTLRLSIANELGESGFQNRDRYHAFGWETDPSDEEYVGLYFRNPFARALIDKPVQTTWRSDPDVIDDSDGDEPTPFEATVQKAARNLDVYSYLARADRAAGFGEYALLFIDFDDTEDIAELDQPVEYDDGDLDNIRGFRVIPQFSVDDVEYGDFGDKRWGEPAEYLVDWSEDVDDEAEDNTSRSSHVHHSRVIEIPSTPPLTEEYSSRPRLEQVLNTLYDIEKAGGAAAEVAFRGADKGLNLNVDPDKVDPSTAFDDDQKQDIQEWLHGLQPTLNTVGTEVRDLGGDVPDPSGLIDTKLTELSAASGMPKRILKGSAAGEIASSETDMRQWFGEVRERQQQFATPYCVRRCWTVLENAGVVPTPEGGHYDVEWPDLFELSEEQEAGIQQKRSQVAKAIGLMGDAAQEYVETGAFPTDSAAPMPPMDESNPAVANQFERQTGNAEGPALDDSVDLPETIVNAAQEAFENDDKIPSDCGTGRGEQRRDQIRNGNVTVADMLTRNNGTPIPAYATSHAADFSQGARNTPVSEWSSEMWQQCGNAGLARWGIQRPADIEWLQERANELAEARGEEKPYENIEANARRYSEGDPVQTPQGFGVVAEIRTEPFEGKDGEIDASDSSPTYVVALKDARVGVGFYSASELSSDELPEVDVENPVDEMASNTMADNPTRRSILQTLTLRDNQDGRFEWPESWQESDTPARVIALKAWASMGGRFRGCRKEMAGEIASPNRFCADFKDRILQWHGWRQ